MNPVTVIGAGLAGCEAAWQLAERGIPVLLCEMKPEKKTPAHKSEDFAELVCSNSLRSDQTVNAVGLLKEEMRRMDSLIIAAADATRVEAGACLAVDRNAFSRTVTNRIHSHPLITIRTGEVTKLPEGNVIVAAGPLATDALTDALEREFPGKLSLRFYDAVAPLVSFESLDMTEAFFASRYDKGTPDYINCALDKEQYTVFRTALAEAQEAPVHGFEDSRVFEGCMPAEVMARRGEDTLRFGPMKPKGLKDPRTGREPYAVLQLRRDNAEGSIYNLVGFQTHLKWTEQKRVFSLIPALRNAEYLRYGVMHRNTYLCSPGFLDRYYRVKGREEIQFAGQITGVEGYVESAASGLLVGAETANRLMGLPPYDFPRETTLGALALYISEESIADFQPMNINFGIMSPWPERVRGGKQEKNRKIAERALVSLGQAMQRGSGKERNA